jgi:hypothetical protein
MENFSSRTTEGKMRYVVNAFACTWGRLCTKKLIFDGFRRDCFGFIDD